jgi:hypothetical protein
VKNTINRSRFLPADKAQLWRPADSNKETNPRFNLVRHVDAHVPSLFVYTSKATLDTVISTPIHFPADVVIESVMASVTGTPVSTNLVWDVLIDGSSIFTNTAERPTIKPGDLYGRITVPSRQGLPASSKLQCQGITLSSATGPLKIIFQLTVL